jgi:hypothetical protein
MTIKMFWTLVLYASYLIRIILALLFGLAAQESLHLDNPLHLLRAIFYLAWILVVRNIENGLAKHLQKAIDKQLRERYPEREGEE